MSAVDHVRAVHDGEVGRLAGAKPNSSKTSIQLAAGNCGY